MADVGALVGDTPVIRLEAMSGQYGAEVLAKLETFNPGGSIKDRTALSLVDDAMARGAIQADTVIIEATSGNTGVALAMACAARGLRLVLFMPEGQSGERKQLFWAYGATIIETPQAERTRGAIVRAKALEARLKNGLMLRQHENPANPWVHEQTTGPEIWRQTNGRVDVFVAGVGTGGTVTGTARYLKGKNPAIEIVAVEPANSPVLSGGSAGSHKIQGIGAGFIPDVLDPALIDRVVDVPDEAAIAAARQMPRVEGLLVGLSSGAVAWAAEELLRSGKYSGKTFVLIFPDSGERYLSTGLYQPTDAEWLRRLVPEIF
ncbi:MAG: cysteine synthase A [Thermaerobacter sp.]|nr:cysteine synthase A [Thermaerobacter sp.]